MKHICIIIMLQLILAVATVLFAVSEVTDDWADSCMQECLKSSVHSENCNSGSIRFIADQYVRAARGEPYWESEGGIRFTGRKECLEYRMKQLHQICPSALSVLKKSVR
ncbi:MAG: hypothetical protein GXY14_14750 [Spirochaetes bacterium]|nr:hypothetical protein [Spirochaetota bacterium]